MILANIQASKQTNVIGEKRALSRFKFMFKFKAICKEMFLHTYGISYSRFRRLNEHYESNGICPRQHDSNKRPPVHSLSQSTVEDMKTFVTNYVEENALPRRIPGYKNDDIQLLSSCDNIIS